MSELKLFTREEVSNNNGKNNKDTWVIIGGNVYDVTKYMAEHPGGAELIEEYAGKDASSAFSDAGHSSDARKHLKSMKIGEIVKEPQKELHKNDESSKQTRSFLDVISCGLCGRGI